jgi:hypothetical protein
MKFNFTDKESYLEWRREWRIYYAELTVQIRRLKRCRKEFLRTYERLQTERGPVRRLVAKIANPETGPVWELPSLRLAAAYQMEIIAEAKALSWQLRQARLAEVAAA